MLLLLWELGVKLFHVSPLLIPSVELVFQTLWESLIHGSLLYQALFSVGIIVLGLFISTCLAVLFAFISYLSPIADSFLETLTTLLHPLPGLAILPVIILWFGVGTGSIIVILVHASLWPILLNLKAGFESVPQIYIDAARNLSMNRLSIMIEVMMRSSASEFLSGIRIGWARAWRALISAEMVFGAVGSQGGIGWYILKQRTFMNTAGLFAGVFVIIIIGLVVEDGLFSWIEKHTIIKWGMKKQS